MALITGVAEAAREVVPARPVTREGPGNAFADRAVRLFAAALWVALGKLLGTWFLELPVLALFGTTSVTFVTAAVLFGWEGIAAAALVQLAYLDALQGLGGVYPWASTAGYVAAATLAWVTFRHVPRLGRGFPDLRSLGWFALSTALGALLSTSLVALTGHEGNVLAAVALWSRSTMVSVWVLAPPLLVLGDRRLRRFLAPIPGEQVTTPARRVGLVGHPLAGVAPQAVDVVSRADSFGGAVARGALAMAAITALRLLLPGEWAHGAAWLNILYLGPIWWMAQRQRLPGALVAVGLASVASLAGDAALLEHEVIPPAVALSIYAQLLSYWLVGALLGRGAEREGELLGGLAELHERLEQDLQRVVWALTGAVEAKDPYTGGHLQRVNAFALAVGRRLGVGGRELELLQIASTLHDIGKIGIPEPILNKPGPLSAAERAVMQRHPEIGARLLQRVEGLREAAPLVLHHQERWDGQTDGTFPGYPAALAGDGIPLGARIIAVVDSFDAMTTDRPYRPAVSPEEARDVLRAERGAQFDPVVVDVFLALLDELPWD